MSNFPPLPLDPIHIRNFYRNVRASSQENNNCFNENVQDLSADKSPVSFIRALCSQHHDSPSTNETWLHVISISRRTHCERWVIPAPAYISYSLAPSADKWEKYTVEVVNHTFSPPSSANINQDPCRETSPFCMPAHSKIYLGYQGSRGPSEIWMISLFKWTWTLQMHFH